MPRKVRKPSLTITYRKLGKEKARGQFISELNLIEIDSRLTGEEHLEVLIHEALHFLLPFLDEEAVEKNCSEFITHPLGGWLPEGSMNPITKWHKWMAVGCSHGDQIDPEARDAALTFQQRWKPKTTLHLGDFLDLAAMRNGAVANPNSRDRAASVSDDLCEGISFLQELRPQHILFGNHEHRLFELKDGPNGLAAHAALTTVEKIEQCAKKLRAHTYPYHIRSYAMLGDTKFMHGFMFNLSAIRDHAETFGRCVIAHIHRTGEEPARNSSGDIGYALGMLARFDMPYAATRRATLAWKQGIAFGEYNDQHCTVNIVSRAYGQPWRLPI